MTDGVFRTAFIRFSDRNIYQYNFEFGAENSVQMTFSFFFQKMVFPVLMRPLLWACLLLHFWWMMEAKKPFSSSATSLKGSSSSVAVGIREPIIPSKGCCNAVQMIHALVHFQVLHKSNFTIRHTFVLECSSFFWQMFAFEKKKWLNEKAVSCA